MMAWLGNPLRAQNLLPARGGTPTASDSPEKGKLRG